MLPCSIPDRSGTHLVTYFTTGVVPGGVSGGEEKIFLSGVIFFRGEKVHAY